MGLQVGTTVRGGLVISIPSVDSGRAIDVTRPPYRVLPGITPNPEVGIQQAIDQAAQNALAGSGPTEVYVPAGTYGGIEMHLIPGQGGGKTYAALWGYSNVTLRFAPGAVLKLKDQLQMPAGGTRGHVIANYGGWRSPTSGGYHTTNFRVLGGEIDCNGANHHATSQAGATYFSPGQVVTEAMHFGYADRSTVVGMKVRDLYGTAPGPPGETFFFNTWMCRDVAFIDCEAAGVGSIDTASGFANGNSVGTRYVGCVAHDLKYGMGFTCYNGRLSSYTGCHAYRCGASGFNVELSYGIAFSACISGGVAPGFDNGNFDHPEFPSASPYLGNNFGWTISGSEEVTIDAACQGVYNTSAACWIYTNHTSTGPKVCNGVWVAGLMDRSGATHDSSDNVIVEHSYDGAGNLDQQSIHVTATGFAGQGPGVRVHSTAPVEEVDVLNRSSGYRHVTKSRFGTWSRRWLRKYGYEDTTDPTTLVGVLPTPDLAITTSGQVFTTGRVRNRTAVAGNYTVLPTDDVIGCTGTATTSQTITLGTAGDTTDKYQSAIRGVGRTVTIKDEAGGAGTNPITVTPAGGQKIEGQSSWTIGTNYGELVLLSTGTGWVILNAAAQSTLDSYQVVKDLGDKRWDAQAAGTFILFMGGAGSAGGANSGTGIFHIDPAKWAVAGKTTKLNLRATVLSNATAPSCTFGFSLNPIGALSGGAASVAQTPGAAVAGSSASIASPAASTAAVAESGDFTVPTAGFYVVQHTISTAMATNSAVVVRAELLMRRM